MILVYFQSILLMLLVNQISALRGHFRILKCGRRKTETRRQKNFRLAQPDTGECASVWSLAFQSATRPSVPPALLVEHAFGRC